MVEIKALRELADFAEVVRLQREIWGYADVELLPSRLFGLADKIGGQVLGAYDGSTIVAFCLSIPGLKPGGLYYWHSHILGVLPAYRNTGLGRAMKLKQREGALERGIKLIEWTFDPLEIKNAYFNIERLGAIVRRFVPNQYGTTSSHLHGGLPTDRLTAEWWLDTPRVNTLTQGRPFQRSIAQESICVPIAVADRLNNLEMTREVQTRIREDFQRCFAEGLAVVGFERSNEEGIYLLGEWESK